MGESKFDRGTEVARVPDMSQDAKEVMQYWERLRPFIVRLSIAKHIDNVLDEVHAVLDAGQDRKAVFAELRSILYRVSHDEKKVFFGQSNGIIQDFINLLMVTAAREGVNKVQELFNLLDTEWSHEFEFQEAIIKSRLELILENHADYLNEGDNAVIFRINLNLLPAKERSEFDDITPDLVPTETNAAAVKVLKFYRRGLAAKELHAHQAWYQVVANHPDKELMAWVPRPADAFEIDIEEELQSVSNVASEEVRAQIEQQNTLSRARISHFIDRGFPYSFKPAQSSQGVEIAQKRVIEGELFMMDYINGKDLATIMLEWIIDHPPAGREALASKRRNMSKQDLRQQVVELLDLQFDDEDTPVAIQQYYIQQAMYKHLKSTGFRVNPILISQIEKTAAVARENNLFHKDAHEGNVLFSGDYYGTDEARAYVIDFGENADTETKELDGIVSLLKSF